MKGNKLKTKIVGLIIAFFIAVILSAIISTMLHLIFTKVPEEILNLTPTKIITSLLTNKEHFEMFVLVVIAFMMFVLLTVFKVFDLKDYKSKNYKVTDNIEIPMPVGDKQTQQGSAWWLSKKDVPKKFGVNRLDPQNPEIRKLIKIANEEKKFIEKDKVYIEPKISIEPIFESGGLIIGKKDKVICRPYLKTIKGKFKIPFLNIRKVEDIYYVKDDLHSLTVGATRSGKSRNLVIETIMNIGLSKEPQNMIISDPKRRIVPIYSKNIREIRL